jgi:probable HAF family extracellular repeat protein
MARVTAWLLESIIGARWSAAVHLGWEKSHAFLLDTNQVTDSGTLSSDPANHNSQTSAINDRGQVVGSSETDSMQSHAFIYENGKMSHLEPCRDMSIVELSGLTTAGSSWAIRVMGVAPLTRFDMRRGR